MRTMKRAIVFFGRMVGIILGGDFTAPGDSLWQNHTFAAFGW